MTRNRGFKRLVRGRARRTNELYSTARAHLRRRRALADAELVTRCAAPIVRRLYATRPIAAEAIGPRHLTRPQGTLLAFWILFTHATDGLTGLCRTLPHRLVDPAFWILIETGLRQDAEVVAILVRLRAEIGRAVATAPGGGQFGWLESLDAELMRELDAEFHSTLPRALHRMANQIRADEDLYAITEVTAE